MTELTSHDLGPAVPRRGNRFTRWLGRRVLAAIGLKVTGELPNFPKMMVIGAPHTSNWDGVMAIGMALALSIDVRVVAKQALFRWPFAGLLRWMGVIGIDRNAAGGVVRELTAEQRAAWVEVMKPVWDQFRDDVGQENIDAAQAINAGI